MFDRGSDSAGGKKQATGPIDQSASRRIGSRGGKVIAGLLVLVFVFSLGVGVGDGRLSLGFKTNPSKVLPNQLDYSSVETVYDSLRDNFDGNLDQAKLLDGLKEGLATASGDPYTQYFNADAAKKFESDLNNEFSGIGAELSKDKDGNIVVVAPITGTPAAKAGVKAKDIIAAINKEPTSGLALDEAISRIRGPKGTKVTLQIIRDRQRAIELTITRDAISVPSVESKVLDGNIGYMRISTFSDDAGTQARTAAQSLIDAKVKAMVLDLRGNPGGRVDAAVDIASLWLPSGKLIMQEKRGNTVQHTYTATGKRLFDGTPTVVLLDAGSASASEIVAGALHDNKLAKLMGEKSYGKGSVQQVLQLNGGAELKVTVARWYRPNGQNIDKKGIDPDVKVKLAEGDTAGGPDAQLTAAEAELNK